MDNYEIDYKQLFEQMKERVESLLKADEEFFALINLTTELKPYCDIVTKHMFDIKKADQIKILKLLVPYGTLCKTLCEKYSLLDEEIGGDEI